MGRTFGWRIARGTAAISLLLGCGDGSTDPYRRGEILAASIERASGEAQTATVATLLPQPIVVRVRDASGNLAPGQTVSFVVTEGGGSVSAPGAVTDAAGEARVRWTLGTRAGRQQLEAAISGGGAGASVVAFTATGTADVPASIALVAGADQQAVFEGWVPMPPRVLVRDRFGNPVPRVGVTFAVATGGGRVVLDNLGLTNAAGEARAWWQLGTGATNTLRISTGALAPVMVSATAHEGPRYLLAFAATPFAALAGTAVPGPPSVLVTEPNAPVLHPSGVALTFVAEGGGTVDAAVHVTDAQGVARVGWTVSAATGANTLVASTADGATAQLVVHSVHPFRASALAVGESHSCGLDLMGALWCWGSQFSGQSGNGFASAPLLLATRVADAPAFASLAAGSNHGCALTSAGAAWCWGANDLGQLGDGSRSSRGAPVPVAGDVAFAKLAAGARHSCGLTAAGQAWCWGANISGQLGTGDTLTRTVPAPVATGDVFVSLAAGTATTCGLRADGVAVCWGSNLRGNVGSSSATCLTGACALLPIAVGGTTRFVSLSLTDEASCGLTAAGELFCWGSLGLFSGNSAVATTPVRLAPSLTFSAIASGSFHLCGLQGSGVAWCWGVNSAGQLGSGASEAIVSAPQRVAGDHVFRAPFAGLRRSCGITADDQAWCWGAPYAGDASASPRSVPVFVGTS